MSEKPPRLAVVLFNLGGPDSLQAVRPFLFNLFSDPAILQVPGPIRTPLAAVIASARAGPARRNYALMGGASPLLRETAAQAKALEAALSFRQEGAEVKVFVAMRYWRPFVADTAEAVAAWAPDEVVLLPLYPQYSATTTGSSLEAWKQAYRGPGRTRAVCCWYDRPGLIEAHVNRIRRCWEAAGQPQGVRVLFSAHGLPEKLIEQGDPYQWQVEATCRAIADHLEWPWGWRICYQSRVGPMKWIGPSTPVAIAETCHEGMGVLIDPVAFVSEHVETLVELDRDYAKIAEEAGGQVYLRAPAVGIEPVFIEELADLVEESLGREGLAPGGTPCSLGWNRCPYKAVRSAA